MGESVMGYLAAVGIKSRMRPVERAAFLSAWATKKLRGVCVCAGALYGNAASRMSELVPTDGMYAYGGYPDIDALYDQSLSVVGAARRGTTQGEVSRLRRPSANLPGFLKHFRGDRLQLTSALSRSPQRVEGPGMMRASRIRQRMVSLWGTRTTTSPCEPTVNG
jgi:hypothetical protein